MADTSGPESIPSTRLHRLYPGRTSRVYWPLTCLRKELTVIAERYLAEDARGTLVDFGCGAMPYRPLFEPRVAEYVGCDLDSSIAGVKAMPEASKLPFGDGSASVVLSTQVLEHVQDPRLYLLEAHRVLGDNGLMFLTTHGVWKYHPDPVDYWRWTSDGLKMLVASCGFEVVHFRGLLGPQALSVQLLQDSVWDRIPRLARRPFAMFMQTIAIMLDSLCPEAHRNRDASIYVVVARKTPSSPPCQSGGAL